jgi:hypothetical protein
MYMPFSPHLHLSLSLSLSPLCHELGFRGLELISLQLIPLKQVCICLSPPISLSLLPLCQELGFRGLELWFVNALTVCTSIVTNTTSVIVKGWAPS